MIKTNGELAALYRETAEFLERHPHKLSYKQVPVLERPSEQIAAGLMLLYVADCFRDSKKDSWLRLEVVKKIEEMLKDPKLFMNEIGEHLIYLNKKRKETV